ncbi:hypothetical protein DFJ58DRAFT_728118 [Suillus subalutaceus]|uniref:uncharacterized protein n=1 Tax=Suillus subalutaceus TaxID=48586 RepID=UPI001B860D2D|nr:uncharacterized protein DFJ58DRAFT_728118 [Suillus subalutaceus]KAG1853723.1 hypothetical protein DFJ58DRAFT_728118 [Suillus subalutaceus]
MCSLNLYATSYHLFLNVYVVLKLLDNIGFLTTMNAPSTSQGAPSWEAVLNARLAQPQPDFIHSCNNCKEEVPWQWCKTNENGNEGRWIVVCKKFAGEQQVPCNFFCWAWGSTSPSSSPTLGSAPLAPTAVVQPSAQLAPTAAIQPAVLGHTTLLVICAALMCRKRPHAQYPLLALRMPHQPQTCLPMLPPPLPMPPPPLPMPPPPPSQPALILDAAPSDLDVPPPLDKGKGRAVELPDASEPVQLPSCMVAGLLQPKARAAPRYAMQMPAIFTQQNACEEEMNEERRQRELERLQAAAQGEEHYGFKLPNFYFTLLVLHKLCMTSKDPDVPAPARIAPIQRYNRALNTWTRFDVGHMVTLHECDAGILFVRDACVRECVDFDQHLHRMTRPVSANLMTDLTSEWKYVHAASLVWNSHTPSLPPTNPAPHVCKPRSHMPSLSPVSSDKKHEVPNDLPAQPIKHHPLEPPIKQHFSSILSLTDSDEDDMMKPVHAAKRHHSPLPQAPCCLPHRK